jgi:hypothetical protein
MREVAACHLSVVVAQAIDERRAGVAGMRLVFVIVVRATLSFTE